MDMKIVGVTVAILVSITVLAGVLMPVLDDATATTDTFKNEGYYHVTTLESTSTDTVTISWDHTAPQKITVNGTDIDLSNVNVDSFSLVFGEDWTIRYLKSGTNRSVQYYGTAGGVFVGAGTAAGTDLTISLASGTMTVTNTASTPATQTHSYDTAYYIAPDGDYVMKKNTTPAYVKPDSTIIIANGITAIGGNAYGIYFEGTIDDGLDFTSFAYYNAPTISDEAIVSTAVSDHVGLSQIDKVTFTLTNNAGTDSVDATYSYFLVPTEVTAERAVHFTDNQNALLAVIPMLVIVALLIGVVALVIRSRLD